MKQLTLVICYVCERLREPINPVMNMEYSYPARVIGYIGSMHGPKQVFQDVYLCYKHYAEQTNDTDN